MRAGAQVFRSPCSTCCHLGELSPRSLGLLICEMNTVLSTSACVGDSQAMLVALLLVGCQDPLDLVQSPFPLFGLSQAQHLSSGPLGTYSAKCRAPDVCQATGHPVGHPCWAGGHPLLPLMPSPCLLHCHLSAASCPSILKQVINQPPKAECGWEVACSGALQTCGD